MNLTVLPKKTAFCLCLFFICSAGFLRAMELEVSTGANFLTFRPNNFMAYSDPAATVKEFKPHPYAFGRIELKDDISEIISYSIRLSRDNILRNSLEGGISAKTDYISFGFGPFIGITDAPEKPFAGMAITIDLAYPGVVFLSVSASSTFGSQYDFTSSHERETVGVKMGFWLPFLIPSFTASIKTFTYQIDNISFIRDSLTRFVAGFDFYMKFFPAVIRLDTGYQIFSRYYNVSSGVFTDEIRSFFAGLEASWEFQYRTKIVIGAELPVIVYATSPMKAPAFYRMFKATLGIIHSF